MLVFPENMGIRRDAMLASPENKGTRITAKPAFQDNTFYIGDASMASLLVFDNPDVDNCAFPFENRF